MGHLLAARPAEAGHSRIDVTVADLPIANHLVLWAMRHWLKCRGAQHCPAAHLSRTFSFAGAPDAVDPFDLAMTFLSCGGRRPLTCYDPHAQDISRDETCLLAVFAALQAGDAMVAHNGISLLASDAVRRMIWQPLSDVAGALAEAGLVLALP